MTSRNLARFSSRRLIEVGLTKDGESWPGGASAVRTAQVHRDRRRAPHDDRESTRAELSRSAAPAAATNSTRTPKSTSRKPALIGSGGAAQDRQPADLPRASAVSKTRSPRTSIRPNRGRERKRRTGRRRTEADVASADIGRRPTRKRRPPKPDATDRARQARRRAATALQLATESRKGRQDDAAALESYRQIVKDYPKTADGSVAAERIKAIESQSIGGELEPWPGSSGAAAAAPRWRYRPSCSCLTGCDPDIQADWSWSRSPSRCGPSRG